MDEIYESDEMDDEVEPSRRPPRPARVRRQSNAGLPADMKMAEIMMLRRLGVDLDFLRTLARGRSGVEWPVPWRMAAEVLYVNGYPPADIERLLGGPAREIVWRWADNGGWHVKRDEFMQQIARRSLEASGESQVEVISRHLKTLRGLQAAALNEIAQKQVSGKSLEGLIAAVGQTIRLERTVMGMAVREGGSGTTVINDNRQQMVIAQMDLPPEARERYFELMRQKFEVEHELQKLGEGGLTDEQQVVRDSLALGHDDAVEGKFQEVEAGDAPTATAPGRAGNDNAVGNADADVAEDVPF